MRANQVKIYRNKYTKEYTFILAVFRDVNNKPGWGATPNDNLKDLHAQLHNLNSWIKIGEISLPNHLPLSWGR